MSDFLEERRKESLDLVEKAKNENKEPKCIVDFKVDSVGSISAMVYGENGMANATLCYNDDTSKRKGAYMLRYSVPDFQKMAKAYSKDSGASIDNLKPNDEAFVNWMRDFFKKSENEQWKIAGASWKGGDFETFETKSDALNALLNGEALGLGVTEIEQERE